jgi:uncharacterized protein (TIGR02453 family)
MFASQFSGFPAEALQFLANLAANNNKPWFDEYKPDYEKYVLAPARDFVLALGAELQVLSPGVGADPRVNKSIFRIYRDVRFSKDKTPYKTNLALWFPAIEGGEKFNKPGYYFSLEADSLMLGVGIYGFAKPMLKAYRDAVVDPELGPELAKIAAQTLAKGYGIGEKTYKRTPRGYDPDHEYADLLLYSGLTGGFQTEIPAELHSGELVDYCFEKYVDLAPLVHWIEKMKAAAKV